MSAISEALEKIASSSDSAGDAQNELNKVAVSLENAIARLNSAAGDTGHAKIDKAMKVYRGAAEKLAESQVLVGEAQEAADEYGDVLG